MTPLIILTCVSLATSALITLVSFRYAVHWQKRQWSLFKVRLTCFDDYWEAKNMVRRWDRTYRWSFGVLIVVLLFSVGLGVFSVAI